MAAGRLLAGRADPNTLDALGEPPLFEAAAAGSRPLVALLLAARAEPRLAVASGITAASLAGSADSVLEELLHASPEVCAAPALAAAQGLSLEARHALLLAAQRLAGKAGAAPSPQPSLPGPAHPSARPAAALFWPPGADEPEATEAEAAEGHAEYSMACWMRPAGNFFKRAPARLQRPEGSQHAPICETASRTRQSASNAKEGKPAARPVFDAEAASAMLDELLEAYAREDFVKACAELNSTFEAAGAEAAKDPAARIAAIEGLCLRLVLGPVLARYGFTPDEDGSREVKGLVAELSANSPAVRERNLRATQLIMGHFRRRPVPRTRKAAMV